MRSGLDLMGFLRKNKLIPKLFTVMKNGYSKEQFLKDFIAGIIVGIIALPLSIALAIASGVSPQQGLYTAIVAGFFISFFGGSLVQIGGPTGAFVVIIYGIVEKHGYNGLIIATIMAGIFLILMGIFQMGSIIKFIPYPITTGFTSGIAIAIFSTQIKDFLGLKIDKVPSEFVEKWETYILNFPTINLETTLIGVLSLIIVFLWPVFFGKSNEEKTPFWIKINKRIPGSVIAIVISTLIVHLLHLNVDTIGSRFSNISSSLPPFTMPNFSGVDIKALISPAITIALLAGIESLLSAVVADGMIGGHHRSNMELVAQGGANVASALFGGIPATGAIARTAANVKNGGRTPIAGIVHAITVMLIMLILMPYAKLIPMPTLAAILIVVAYNMGEWEEFRTLLKAPKSDALVFLATFLLTVFVDLVVAIEIGMILAAFLFMKRMADVTDVKLVEENEDEELVELEGAILLYKKAVMDYVLIYEINGPFFFGAADKFLEISNQMGENKKVLLLRMGKVPAMDATGFHALEMIHNICKSRGITIIICKIQQQPMKILEKYGFIEKIGKENFYDIIDLAMERAADIIIKARK